MMRVGLSGKLYAGVSFASALTLLGCGANDGSTASEGSATEAAYPISLEEGSHGMAIVNIGDLGPQKVEYVVKNGVPIHSGDIIVNPEELSGGLADARTTSAGRRNENYKWPLARVPWEVDTATIPVNGALWNTIQSAMTAWRTNLGGTPITFPQHTPGSGGDYLYITADLGAGSGGWSSAIGRYGGKQTVRLGATSSIDVVEHELGHVLGLYHEQQRADRNSYLKVYDGTNGMPDRFAGCWDGKGNYFRYSDSAVGPYGNDGIDLQGTLDFNSIMMYGAPLNDCCGLPCMTDLAGKGWPTPTTISVKDNLGINRMYLRFQNQATFGTPAQFRNMAISSWGGSRTDIVAVRQSDNHVIHASNDGLYWTGFNEDMGGNSTLVNGRISSVSWGPGRIDWVSISSAGSVTHGWWNQGSGPGGVEDFGSVGCSGATGVTISSRGSGMLDIFAVCGPSGTIMRKSYNAGWTGWLTTHAQTGFTGNIDAVSWGPSRVDIAVTSNTSPPQLKHLWWNVSGPWYIETLTPSIPDALLAQPVSAASWGLGRLDIFFNGSNSTAYRMSYEGGWGGAMPVGASNAVIGDAVGHMSGSENVLDYVFFDNLSGGYFKHAQARR